MITSLLILAAIIAGVAIIGLFVAAFLPYLVTQAWNFACPALTVAFSWKMWWASELVLAAFIALIARYLYIKLTSKTDL